jgi:hypothetical protein
VPDDGQTETLGMLAPMTRRIALLAVVATFAIAAPASALTLFRSPSGNIGCALDKGGVRCDIRQRSWSPPPKPKWCDLDWGQGLTVAKRGKGHYVCAGDTVLGARRVLRYGKAIRRGRFRCASRRSGMRCVNRTNGHGFTLSREHAHVF